MNGYEKRSLIMMQIWMFVSKYQFLHIYYAANVSKLNKIAWIYHDASKDYFTMKSLNKGFIYILGYYILDYRKGSPA